MLGRAPDLSVVDGSQRFRALFGTSPSVFCRFWQMFVQRRPENSKPYHMLCALMFLKVYASENDHAALAGVDEKTYRKWQWTFARLIARLKWSVLTKFFKLFLFIYFLSSFQYFVLNFL